MAPGEVAVEGADAIEARWARQLTLDGFDFSLTAGRHLRRSRP